MCERERERKGVGEGERQGERGGEREITTVKHLIAELPRCQRILKLIEIMTMY